MVTVGSWTAPGNVVALHDFLATYKPSKNQAFYPDDDGQQVEVDWFWVRRCRSIAEPDRDHDTFAAEGEKLKTALRAHCSQIEQNYPVRGKPSQKSERDKAYARFAKDVEVLAKRYGILSGKWMIMAHPDVVDETWSKIAYAIGAPDGALRSTACHVAKVSPTTNNSHLICIYCDDSYDRMGVAKVGKVLSEDLGFGPRLSYKTDAFTHLDIYSSANAERPGAFKAMPTTLYRSVNELKPELGRLARA